MNLPIFSIPQSCHPELVSGSQEMLHQSYITMGEMLKQVQHDKNSCDEPPCSLQQRRPVWPLNRKATVEVTYSKGKGIGTVRKGDLP
ncbi:hypothetical protein BMS3Bbin06_00379 [bacterium BMS3Bbin06]|nr:hypothetical protein BMS3Abin08_01876 [bacterium BMS3Abin08]GBE33864.1 hypothetical protein BMS3Bbin06_00379 [bacterium BMS3Bbin06]